MCLPDAVLLGWPLARLDPLAKLDPHALDSVQKICAKKIFKIFSKNGDSGLRGG